MYVGLGRCSLLCGFVIHSRSVLIFRVYLIFVSLFLENIVVVPVIDYILKFFFFIITFSSFTNVGLVCFTINTSVLINVNKSFINWANLW